VPGIRCACWRGQKPEQRYPAWPAPSSSCSPCMGQPLKQRGNHQRGQPCCVSLASSSIPSPVQRCATVLGVLSSRQPLLRRAGPLTLQAPIAASGRLIMRAATQSQRTRQPKKLAANARTSAGRVANAPGCTLAPDRKCSLDYQIAACRYSCSASQQGLISLMAGRVSDLTSHQRSRPTNCIRPLRHSAQPPCIPALPKLALASLSG